MGSARAEALWLETLQRIAGLAAHEVKGALNGVSLNVEVVRSRADKPDTLASNVSKFANAASQQLEVAIAMTEALLTLARDARQPVQPATVAAQIGALLVPAARADGKRLEVGEALDDSNATSADGTGVRVAIGACLLAALEQSTDARCRWDARALRIESCDGTQLSVSPEITAVAANAGIQIVADSSVITISFPGSTREVAETA